MSTYDFNNQRRDQQQQQIQEDGTFELAMSGIIESGTFDDLQSMNVKYDITQGYDWKKIEGQSQGISQIASSNNYISNELVWNFPVECMWQTSNPLGWPQITIQLYGPDAFGRSMLQGYGCVHIPTTPGSHVRTVYIFKPLPTSWFTGLLGYFQGRIAEYTNPKKTLSTGEGREVTRVQNVGSIKIKFQIMTRNMKQNGF